MILHALRVHCSFTTLLGAVILWWASGIHLISPHASGIQDRDCSQKCCYSFGRKSLESMGSRACSNRSRGNGCKMKEGRFWLGLDIRRKFFAIWVVRHWPRKAVDLPSLEVFKTSLDGLWAAWSAGRLPGYSRGAGNEMVINHALT